MLEFSIEPEFQEKLDWMAQFVREEVQPLDLLFPHGGDPYDVNNPRSQAIVRSLQQRVREQRLWAAEILAIFGARRDIDVQGGHGQGAARHRPAGVARSWLAGHHVGNAARRHVDVSAAAGLGRWADRGA
jgi:acyl-CoA dehydrogenase